MMKYFLLILLQFSMIRVSGQIAIDNVGDDWKLKVEKALVVIETSDSLKYKEVLKYCKHIGYWNGKFSTTEGPTTVLISQKDMQSTSINNIAAIIVHESKHLFYVDCGITLPPNDEEVLCYKYELSFLTMIPNVEPWLIENAKNCIKYYEGLK